MSVSCLAWRYELDSYYKRIQTSNFLSATVLNCRQSNSHHRSGRDTEKTVLSCPAWRCELALRLKRATTCTTIIRHRMPHVSLSLSERRRILLTSSWLCSWALHAVGSPLTRARVTSCVTEEQTRRPICQSARRAPRRGDINISRQRHGEYKARPVTALVWQDHNVVGGRTKTASAVLQLATWLAA